MKKVCTLCGLEPIFFFGGGGICLLNFSKKACHFISVRLFMQPFNSNALKTYYRKQIWGPTGVSLIKLTL